MVEPEKDNPATDYRKGFIDGLRAFAWWKDGVQYVGTTGMTLKEAIEKVDEVYGFKPPDWSKES